MDEPPELPPRSPEELRQLRRWIWVVWIGTGVFVVAQALVVPIILNYVLIAVWLLASIAQLIVKFRQRRKGAGPKQSR